MGDVLWTQYCPGPPQPLSAHPRHPQSDTKTPGRTLLLAPSPRLPWGTVTPRDGETEAQHSGGSLWKGPRGGDSSPLVAVVAQSRQHSCPGWAGGLAPRRRHFLQIRFAPWGQLRGELRGALAVAAVPGGPGCRAPLGAGRGQRGGALCLGEGPQASCCPPPPYTLHLGQHWGRHRT